MSHQFVITRPSVWAAIAGAMLCSACSSHHALSSGYPYDPNTTSVIGNSATGSSTTKGSSGKGSTAQDPFGNATGTSDAPVGVTPVSTYVTPSGDACLDPDGQCVAPQKDCASKDATADVILGTHGEVLSTICYPNHDYSITTVGDAPAPLPPLGNNTVVVVDGNDDGVDIQGDVTIKGNNVILYGQGPDTSVIGGNLDIEKNNAIVRGVRIQGDATISKNNASLIDCVIEGDLSISGNNVSLALCEIWGKVSIEGNNTVFVSNLVAGDQSVSGKNVECNDNHHFTDSDGDHVVDANEVLAVVACNAK